MVRTKFSNNRLLVKYIITILYFSKSNRIDPFFCYATCRFVMISDFAITFPLTKWLSFTKLYSIFWCISYTFKFFLCNPFVSIK